jgi:hypothetical protein
MTPGTSPSIAGLAGGGLEVAFQANTGQLYVTGAAGTLTGLGMAPGTSPSITARPSGGYDAVFQANTGNLWMLRPTGATDQVLGMAGGTSPSAN